jgi:LPXTG-motif cell wall-anchored protein
MRRLLVTLVVLGQVAGAAAQPAAPASEIDQILAKLADADLVERTYGALAIEHFARKQWGFSLFSQAGLRPWQRALVPATGPLVELLSHDAGLEWIDQNGMTEKTTTPRQEATRALLALERVSVEPLLAALERPPLTRKADEVLRRIVRGGPAGHDQAAWGAWWAQHRQRPLPNEHGQWWLLALGGLLLAATAALVFRKQRTDKRRLGLAAASQS